MPRFRYASRPVEQVAGEPFADAEEAWLWSHQCLADRGAGARIEPRTGGLGKVCSPLDVLITARRLALVGGLARDQFGVLMRFGARLLPPDPRDPAEAPAAATWQAALARLDETLRIKGFVA